MRIHIQSARFLGAVTTALILAQFEIGWYGWAMNGILFANIIGISFFIGWLQHQDDEPPMHEGESR